jgi:acetyl-CoA carboxylase, biotin carboxylase subunit
LFQRILADGDFQLGKIDTGYLERLLATGAGSGSDQSKDRMKIAAIAAAVFTLLDSTSKVADNSATSNEATSNWKNAARSEGLM